MVTTPPFSHKQSLPSARTFSPFSFLSPISKLVSTFLFNAFNPKYTTYSQSMFSQTFLKPPIRFPLIIGRLPLFLNYILSLFPFVLPSPLRLNPLIFLPFLKLFFTFLFPSTAWASRIIPLVLLLPFVSRSHVLLTLHWPVPLHLPPLLPFLPLIYALFALGLLPPFLSFLLFVL